MEDLTGQVDTVDSITATEWNNHYQEFKNLITTMGLSMSAGDLFQLMKAVVSAVHRADFYTDSGTANAYVLSPIGSVPGLPAYVDGAIVRFRPANNGTGAATVNVNGLGSRTVLREDGTAVQSGDFSTARDAVLRYTTTGPSFRLMNYALGAPAQALPSRYIWGLTMGRNPSEPATEFRDIQIQIGACRDFGNTANLVIGTTLTKRFDAAVASGNAAGGYPTAIGARTVSTWYRFFIVGRVNGDIDAGFDTSATATNLLAAFDAIDGAGQWTRYRQLGWVRTTAADANELCPFLNDPSNPEDFIWTSGVGAFDWEKGSAYGSSGLQTAELITLDFVPPNATAHLAVRGFTRVSSGTSGAAIIVRPVGHPAPNPSRSVYTVYCNDIGAGGGSSTAVDANSVELIGHVKCQVDASRQLYLHAFTIGSNFYPFADVTGFTFKR